MRCVQKPAARAPVVRPKHLENFVEQEVQKTWRFFLDHLQVEVIALRWTRCGRRPSTRSRKLRPGFLNQPNSNSNIEYLQVEVIRFAVDAVRAEAFNPRTLFLFGSYTIGKERLFLEVARQLRLKVRQQGFMPGVFTSTFEVHADMIRAKSASSWRSPASSA